MIVLANNANPWILNFFSLELTIIFIKYNLEMKLFLPNYQQSCFINIVKIIK